MKALQYVQVLLLVAGLVYLAAFHFANPGAVTYPAPVASRLVGRASLGMLAGFLAGLAYASLLYLPPALRGGASLRRHARRLRELEAELARLREPAELPVIPDRGAPEPADGKAGRP